MAIEYLSYAGNLPYQTGESSSSFSTSGESPDGFGGMNSAANAAAGGTTWDASGGVASSYSSSSGATYNLYDGPFVTVLTSMATEYYDPGDGFGGPGPIEENPYVDFYSTIVEWHLTGQTNESSSYSTSEYRGVSWIESWDYYSVVMGTYAPAMQTSTTVEQTAYGSTTTTEIVHYVPTITTTTGTSTTGSYYTLGGTTSRFTETTAGGTGSRSYAQLALTSVEPFTTQGAINYNTIVIADTAAGEFLIVLTSEGEGMLSDLCTTATATTFYGSAFTPGGGGGQDYIYTTLGSDYTTTIEVASTLGTGTATIQIAAFPALTSARTYEIASLTSTTTAPYSDNGFDQWTFPLPALTDATQYISPAPSVAPYTENYTGPAAMGYFPFASTTGMVPVRVAIGSPLPAIPRMQVITGSAQTLFSESAFASSMAVPPSTTNLTNSSGFAEAINAGVMVGSYPAEQWVSVAPGVVMPMPVDTFLPLNYTQDSHTQGSCAVTTSASVSYGCGGYSVTTATSSGSGSEATTVNGTTFYSFAGVGMTSAVSQLDSIAGGNAYFPSAIYAGTSMTLELQTWDATSSGTLLTTFSGSDEVSGDGLSLVVPDVSAVAYHWMDFPTITSGGQYTSYFEAAPYLVSNPG